jgi:predicted nucleotidyltransferase
MCGHEVFGSAARAGDFDPARSDIDFLVEFAAEGNDLARFMDFKEVLEALSICYSLPRIRSL